MIIRVLLTLALAAQTSSIGRWVMRADIYDVRTPATCWDYIADDGRQATMVVRNPRLGETLLWGVSYEKGGRPDAFTRLTYLGRDDAGISLELLMAPATRSRALPPVAPSPADSCLAGGLLAQSENEAGAVPVRSIRTPSPPTVVQLTVGTEPLRMHLDATEAGIRVTILER